MATGLETAALVKVLTPLVGELCKEAKGGLKDSFKKWQASGFAAKLARKLSVADRIKTIWSPDKETSLLKIYFPSKISFDDKAVVPIESLANFPEGNIIIEGIVGHGKSIFLRYLCLQEMSGKGTGKLPIFIELRTLTDKRGLDVHIQEVFEKMDLCYTSELFDYMADSGKIALLLDGFDELDEAIVSQTLSRIEYFSERYSELKIFITTRPSAAIQYSRLFKKVNLIGLASDDHTSFLRKLGVSAEKTLEIVEAINISPVDIKNLINTPLMLTLVVIVYESEKDIPAEMPEFFEKLFSTMFTRHDKIKAGFNRRHHSGLSERKLQSLFELFCFASMRYGYGRSLNSEQFTRAFNTAQKHSSEKCELEKFRLDIVKVSCLMLEEGFDLTTFLHKSICEYFAAAFVLHSSDATAEQFYKRALEEDYWAPVLSFLEKIDSYRFSKYYIIPSHSALLAEFNDSLDITAGDWIRFMIKKNPKFKVQYENDNSETDSPTFDRLNFGPFEAGLPWGAALQADLVNAVVSGMSLVVPFQRTRAELEALDDVFYPQVPQNGGSAFGASLEKIFSEYGADCYSNSFHKFESNLRKRLEQAQNIVSNEANRLSLIDDSIL